VDWCNGLANSLKWNKTGVRTYTGENLVSIALVKTSAVPLCCSTLHKSRMLFFDFSEFSEGMRYAKDLTVRRLRVTHRQTTAECLIDTKIAKTNVNFAN
jgi:hypothetical protein